MSRAESPESEYLPRHEALEMAQLGRKFRSGRGDYPDDDDDDEDDGR